MSEDKDILGVKKSYCISMKSKEHIWTSLLNKIHSNGFPSCEIFEGIVGNTYKKKDVSNILSVWQEYIIKFTKVRHNHGHFSTWGGLGCYLSHAAIWKDAVKKGYDKIAIFEDDLYFVPNFKERVEQNAKLVPSDYQMLLLGAYTLNGTDIYKGYNTITKINNFFCTHSYIIDNSCMRILLSRLFPIELQLDSYMSCMIRLYDIKTYNIEKVTGQMHIDKSSIQTDCVDCPSWAIQ